jgi:hypothetical protein
VGNSEGVSVGTKVGSEVGVLEGVNDDHFKAICEGSTTLFSKESWSVSLDSTPKIVANINRNFRSFITIAQDFDS